MTTRPGSTLDDENRTARRASAGGPAPNRRVRRGLALAGIAAVVLPGCMLIANLSQFDGAVQAPDASADGAAADASPPRDVVSDHANAGEGGAGDGATGDGAADDATDAMDGGDGSDGYTMPPPPEPALAPDAATVGCPTTINGAIDANSPVEVGRHSRLSTSLPSSCGNSQLNPGNGADPTGLHFYAVYRFSNPGAAPACFNFTLTYDGAVAPMNVGSDAGGDASSDAASNEAGVDGGAGDAAADSAVMVPLNLQKYMVAYTTFFPTDILSTTYIADVGFVTQPPQTMGVTVPAGGTIDVVIEAVGVAPDAGLDTFTLTCATQ